VLIESDLFIAVIKDKDRLKPAATKIMEDIQSGRMEDAYASVAAIQEVIFWLVREGRSDEVLSTVNILLNVKNLEWVDLSKEICLNASAIMKEFKLSPFDSYHAATAISRDNKIISSDHVYDKIKSLERASLASISP